MPQADALRLDRAPVRFDQLLDDRQSQPQAAVPPCGRGVGLSKAFEHVGQKVRLDALAGITDAQLHLLAAVRGGNTDPALRRSELDGIGQQVPKHLLQARRIAADGRAIRAFDRELNFLGLRRRLNRFDRCQYQPLDVDALDFESDPA